MKLKKMLNGIYSRHTGKPVDVIGMYSDLVILVIPDYVNSDKCKGVILLSSYLIRKIKKKKGEKWKKKIK